MYGSAAGAAPDPFFFFGFRASPSSPKMDPTTVHLISTAASFHLLRLSLKRLSRLDHVHRVKKFFGRAFQIKEANFHNLSNGAFKNSYSACYCLFNGGETRNGRGNDRLSRSGTSPNKFLNRRQWTNVLLAINVVTYIAQVATQGKLMLWGAKINSLIDQGQMWRLATSSFLHANIGHLMINCYSLNSVGPGIENISGPRRFLAVYMTSAITSSVASYWFSKAPAVGASGAVFGLVGSLAVFVIRHRGMVKGGNEDLQRIAQVLILNMVIGLSTRGIDNWGHVGGLLGGAATSWFLGPAWKYESLSKGRGRVFVDKAPIFYLTKGRKQKW